MKTSETFTVLRKLKVDCIYNKDTQFNASVRVYVEANRFKLFLVLGTIFASFSTIMNVGLWDKFSFDTTTIQVGVNLLGAMGGFLILYSTTFSDHHSKRELSNNHGSVANSLNFLYKKIRLTEAAYSDDLINDNELLRKVDEYSTEYHSICNAAPITLEEDFIKAKANFDNGYSEYTEKELSI